MIGWMKLEPWLEMWPGKPFKTTSTRNCSVRPLTSRWGSTVTHTATEKLGNSCKFEQKATAVGVKDKDAKVILITLLNKPTMQVLDQYIILRGEVDSADLTAEQRLNRVPDM